MMEQNNLQATLNVLINILKLFIVKHHFICHIGDNKGKIPCYSIFSFMCMFCGSLFVLLYVFFWPLRCLFVYDIQILITSPWFLLAIALSVRLRYTDSDYLPLVSLNSVYCITMTILVFICQP